MKNSTNSSSPSLLVVNNVMYIGWIDGGLYVVDATIGEMKWTFLPSAPVDASSPPTLSNGIVYVGSFSGNIYALDAETGQKRPAHDAVHRVPGARKVTPLRRSSPRIETPEPCQFLIFWGLLLLLPLLPL